MDCNRTDETAPKNYAPFFRFSLKRAFIVLVIAAIVCTFCVRFYTLSKWSKRLDSLQLSQTDRDRLWRMVRANVPTDESELLHEITASLGLLPAYRFMGEYALRSRDQRDYRVIIFNHAFGGHVAILATPRSRIVHHQVSELTIESMRKSRNGLHVNAKTSGTGFGLPEAVEYSIADGDKLQLLRLESPKDFSRILSLIREHSD